MKFPQSKPLSDEIGMVKRIFMRLHVKSIAERITDYLLKSFHKMIFSWLYEEKSACRANNK